MRARLEGQSGREVEGPWSPGDGEARGHNSMGARTVWSSNLEDFSWWPNWEETAYRGRRRQRRRRRPDFAVRCGRGLKGEQAETTTEAGAVWTHSHALQRERVRVRHRIESKQREGEREREGRMIGGIGPNKMKKERKSSRPDSHAVALVVKIVEPSAM